MVKTPQKATAIGATVAWIGSVPSLIFHSIVFGCFFTLTILVPAKQTTILLIWNTIVSLEAIYLAIFIQFTVNQNTKSLAEVEEDIDEIQEDVGELGEDIDEIHEDLEEISEDADEDEKRDVEHAHALEHLTTDIKRILAEVEALKK